MTYTQLRPRNAATALFERQWSFRVQRLFTDAIRTLHQQYAHQGSGLLRMHHCPTSLRELWRLELSLSTCHKLSVQHDHSICLLHAEVPLHTELLAGVGPSLGQATLDLYSSKRKGSCKASYLKPINATKSSLHRAFCTLALH